MAKSFDDANIVTRVKVRDTEDGAVVGLFHKRSKLFEFDAEDASREGWEDEIDAVPLAKPRTDKDVEAFLTSEADEEGEEAEGGSIVPNKYRSKLRRHAALRRRCCRNSQRLRHPAPRWQEGHRRWP
jgi:hypothetical protein